MNYSEIEPYLKLRILYEKVAIDRLPVAIFGLPRSGTNFMEWSLIHNFKDISYFNSMLSIDSKIPNEVKEFLEKENKVRYYNAPLTQRDYLLKHSIPTLKFSDYAIVIYKDKPLWQAGLKRAYGKAESHWSNYEYYLESAKKLPTDKVIVVNHNWAYNNYFELMEQISKKFGLELKEEIIQPMNRMNKEGHSATQSNAKYNHNP